MNIIMREKNKQEPHLKLYMLSISQKLPTQSKISPW